MINEKSTPTTWADVCALTDLEPEWGEAALVDDQQLAVFRLWDDRVVVTSNIDPRTGAAVLSRGIVGTRAGSPTVASPLHKESYSLLTGECFGDPTLRLEIIATRVVDGRVQVERRCFQELPREDYERLSA
jgi:nitrite reductase (NADH) small subunit